MIVTTSPMQSFKFKLVKMKYNYIFRSLVTFIIFPVPSGYLYSRFTEYHQRKHCCMAWSETKVAAAVSTLCPPPGTPWLPQWELPIPLILLEHSILAGKAHTSTAWQAGSDHK